MIVSIEKLNKNGGAIMGEILGGFSNNGFLLLLLLFILLACSGIIEQRFFFIIILAIIAFGGFGRTFGFGGVGVGV
jgi:hypothetical protein